MDVGQSGKAKAGEIEERKNVASAEITQARHCVAATKPSTTLVVQEMDPDDEDVRVQEAEASQPDPKPRWTRPWRMPVALCMVTLIWAESRINSERNYHVLSANISTW